MKPLIVVEAKVSVQSHPIAHLPCRSLPQAAPEALDENVVQGTATAVHADGNAVALNELDILGRDELAALVVVDNLGASVANDGFQIYLSCQVEVKILGLKVSMTQPQCSWRLSETCLSNSIVSVPRI